MAATLAALARQPGLRLAEPGEFTRRAVENGRLDLTRAEAIADLVDAETEMQRRQALRQFDGALAQLYDEWRTRLIRSAAWIEAVLDFPDEDIPAQALAESHAALAGLAAEITRHLDDGRRGEILRDGLHVAVIGPPNSGKSALVNALAQRDIAIVSDIAGTTRDIIEVRLDIAGYPVILADTAGLRETGDAIEREGVRRARARAEMADIRLMVLDGSGSTDRAEDFPAAELVVWNKADIAPHPTGEGLWISAKTGAGLDALIARLAAHASRMAGQGGEAPVLTRARHRQALSEAAEALARAHAASAPEFSAEYIRQALHNLGRVTGRVDLDELLDAVFRDFCIGK
jgi:tRNA modification GTPase